MNQSEIIGYHSEWNLVCPGGFDYQRMAQVRGKLCWQRIQKISGIRIELSFDHPFLNPVQSFLDMLLRAHRMRFSREKPFILLVAEKETLDKVPENINAIKFLNRIEDVEAVLTCPEELEIQGDRVAYRGRAATVIFLDMKNDALVKIGADHSIEPLLTGIKHGIVVNPRGIEPLGVKGLFEAVTGELSSLLSPAIVKHTPWTRLFYPRKTTGPKGELIPDLVKWARDHWTKVVLKPVYGFSGRGIFVGSQSAAPDDDIQMALETEPYIVQSFIPKELWAEEYPWLDQQDEAVILKQWQTDFRCLINDSGLIGFAARFGGIPTNVGSGGGNQSVAILNAAISPKNAVDRINDAILEMKYSDVMEIQEKADQKGLELGHTYLKGPTPTTLRPRIITRDHLTSLQKYSANLWNDLLILEKIWREGNLDHVIELDEDEAKIARMQPWEGSAALIASDCLFSFGAHL